MSTHHTRYTALGTRLHDQGRPWDGRTVEAALTAAALPGELASAQDDEGWDAAVRSSHRQGQQRTGQASGSPIVAFGESRALFGPILTEAPSEEDARRLYTGVATLAGVGAFSELKRARD